MEQPAEGSAIAAAANADSEDTARPRRGGLKVYLGAAPGCGKTFAMLREGRDRRADGEDVVVGFVETHGRPRTAEAIGNLEVVPRLSVAYRGTTLTEMDIDAVLSRRPEAALVDELAHTNAPGVRHPKRWEDVNSLREAGIDVITTVNVQHLESVKDLVEAITGITVRETVPDVVIDEAEDIQFIDITPQALRKRMRHGNVYPPERVETALSHFFREGNLAALREIALRRMADRLGATHASVRPAPEDVLVAVNDDEHADVLIRRAVRIARWAGGFCSVLHVGNDDPAAPWRHVAASLDCPVLVRQGAPADVIAEVARQRDARHVVVGEPRPGLSPLLRASIVDRLVERLTDADLHIIARFERPRDRQVRPPERPAPETFLAMQVPTGRHGELRLYLGYAHGCGTTTAMLAEGARRKKRGTDVVVGVLATPDRPGCREVARDVGLLGGPNSAAARGLLDMAALMARNPDVVCLDDLGGITTDHRPIWKVVPEIVAAGIVVVATVHMTDLRSTRDALGDRVEFHPGSEPIDDAVLDSADEIELIDIDPQELGERLRDGELMPAADAARALQKEYRPDVLAALREMSFRRIAGHTDRRLLQYMRTKAISAPWEVRPRVVVCVPPRPGMAAIIERAAELARRRDHDLVALTVRRRARSDDEKRLLGEYAALIHQLGGESVTLDGRDVAETIAAYAHDHLITELIAVRGRDERRARILRRLVALLADVDIHVLSEERETELSGTVKAK